MGMYTELYLSLELKDLPEQAKCVLENLFSNEETDKPNSLPDHVFFRTPHWGMIGRCSSYYFVPYTVQCFRKDKISGTYILITRSDLKNYSGEIEKFLDWIAPYIDSTGHIGHMRYEEDEFPTILMYDGEKIVCHEFNTA